MSAGQVKSAMRVFSVLKLFETEQRRLKICEIVEALDYPQSSVSTLMRTLHDSGYITYHPSDRSYSPAPQLAFLGHWALGHRESVEILQGVMRRLSDNTGESVVLAARHGILVQYVKFTMAESGLAFKVSEGTTRPLHKSALGLMLMSPMDDTEVGKIVRRYQTENPDQEVTPLSDVLERVRSARANGHFVSRNILTAGVSVVATLIPSLVHSRKLAIGIAGPTDRVHENVEESLRYVKLAALDYHRAMVDLKNRTY